MKDQFVTYEIAKQLKELGFNEPCLSTYTWDGIKTTHDTLTCLSDNKVVMRERLNINSDDYTCSAPLWQQAIDWLREEKNIEVKLSHNPHTQGNKGFWEYLVTPIYPKGYVLTGIDTPNRIGIGCGLPYNECREQAVIRALGLIKKPIVIICESLSGIDRINVEVLKSEKQKPTLDWFTYDTDSSVNEMVVIENNIGARISRLRIN